MDLPRSSISFKSDVDRLLASTESGGILQNLNKGYIPQAAGGKIKFQFEGMENRVVASKYIYVEEDSVDQLERITSDMVGKWDLATPKLVLSIISSTKHFKPWRYQEDIINFQEGLMKAAGLAEMIVLVEGQSYGVTQIIGDAVAKEKNRRKILAREQSLLRFVSSDHLPRLTVMGLVPQQALSQAASDSVSESAGTSTLGKHNLLISQVDESIDGDSNSLDSNLSHFFIMNKDLGAAGQASFANHLEVRLSRRIGGDRRRLSLSFEEDVGSIPLIGLLVQGGPQEIDHVLALVKKNVPVIVLWGLGMAGDIIAYAMRESQQSYDSYTYEMYVKTELRRMITDFFPDEFVGNNLARNQCRDRVLQCVACAARGDSSLLTLVNVHAADDLSTHILMSVLTSYNMRPTQAEQIQFSLQLCLDWKSPELAGMEIFSKYSRNLITITPEMFQQALLRPDREDFVDMFLNRGFVLHTFLTKDRLVTLFENCHDMDFFAGICLETLLGISLTQFSTDNFVGDKNCQLNMLLRYLTSLNHLIDPDELTINAGPDRMVSPAVAEKKAIYALLFWAALTNNIKLVWILWRKTCEPMAAGLVLSTFYSRMAKHYIDDHDLRLNIKQIGIEFGQCAVKLLDFAYQESRSQAALALSQRLPDFNNLKVTELARLGKNKFFIAHPCCQQLIYRQWYGSVRFPSYYYIGIFHVPDIVKMIASMILIIPSYFLVDIVRDKRYTAVNANRLTQFKIIERATRRQKSKENEKTATDECLPFESIRSLFLIQKLYYMWTAPVTKYWLTQISYMMFLYIYAVSVMKPFCGDPFLNKIVAAWLLVLFIEEILNSATKRIQGSDSFIPHLTVLLVMFFTLFLVVGFRVLHPTLLSFMAVKIMLSFSLLYFFYKGMGLMFPASQTLGPMFLNITTMMQQDLFRWLRIWVLTLISGAISIQAVLYPADPLDLKAASKAFLRGLMVLFETDVSDLAGEPCSCLYNNFSSCNVESFPATARKRMETCPYSSIGGYVVVLRYLFDTKLVYYVLIFAICSTTMANTYEKSIEIWKYQFFLLVQDYSRRWFLPVPFVAILYPFVFIWFCYNTIDQLMRKHCACCKSQEVDIKKEEEYNMWKAYVKALGKQEKLEKDKKNLMKSTEQRLSDLRRQQTTFRRVITNLNDRLVELLHAQTTESLMMERLTETVEALRLNKMDADLPQSLQHRQCRLSPYPGTSIRRFAVFDKNVSWEEPYPSYDPPLYTKPLSDFDEAIRPFVDLDVFDLVRLRDQQERLDTIGSIEGEPLTEFKPEYNTVQEATARNGETFTLDRTVWGMKDRQAIIYTLDLTGVPRNPMGRTGMRGRGNLWRWGPNHAIYSIVSRWRQSTTGGVQAPLLVNGKKVLEILVMYNERLREDSLPGAFVSGRTSKYSVMCETFMRDLMGVRDIPGSAQLDQDDMIQFYRQFLGSEASLSTLLIRAVHGTSSFSSQLVYRGYMDDKSNTDNAWVDAEIWNFHYNGKDNFDQKIIDHDKRWREASVLMQLDSSQLHHVLEVTKLHTRI